MTVLIDLLDITTPLGPDQFRIMSVSGSGQISQPFSYRIILRSGTTKLDENKLLHKPVTVSIVQTSVHACFLNGLVSHIQQFPTDSRETWDYSLTIVPTIAFLEQTRDCRFFENQSSLDIVESIFSKFGISNYKVRGAVSPPKRAYTTMFNETYLDFIHRLFAEDGIFYFFEHTDSDHTMIIGADNTAFKLTATSPYGMTNDGGILTGFERWTRTDTTTYGNVDTGDYNPETSTTPVKAAVPSVKKAAGLNVRAHYHWPSQAADSDGAKTLADRQLQAHEVSTQLYHGSANIPDLYAGCKFELENDPVSGTTSQYVLSAVSILVEDHSDQLSGSSSTIRAGLTAFAAKTNFKPVPHPKPVPLGLYSATVIGESNEEIYTDKLGRIKVQFPWDHLNETTWSGTFWVRVVQPWAGAGWGAQFIPRVGMEVLISFLEGDIDRPVAIGALFNSNNTPIFSEADKNKSGFRSRSTKKGGAADYNEISFDDTKGSEVLLVHAQKNHITEVENDQSLTVDKDRAVLIKKDETVTIKGKQTIKVTGAVLYESDESITLKVGGNSIVINTSGITVKGTKVTITGEATLKTTSPDSTHEGQMMMTLTGGVIKIN
jgi:type VI secretion system secreted protein VgrG